MKGTSRFSSCVRRALPLGARGLLVALAVATAVAAEPPVRQIEIDSGWGGLGTPARFNLTLRSTDRGFDATKVQALVDAMSAPRMAHPTRENLGLSVDWLRSNARRLLSEHDSGFRGQARNLQQLQIDSLTNPVFVDKLLHGIFDSFHTDDYPGVCVRVTLANGATISAESHAQGPYMLPWTVTPGGNTYNAGIARALIALLPPKTVNRDRLAGGALPGQLVDAVQFSLKELLEQLDAENRAPDALAALRRHYRVIHAEVNPYHHPEYGRWPSGGEINLHVELHRAGFPRNLVTTVVLPHDDGKTEGTDAFLANISKYEALVTSTPWLMSYIHAHPKVPVRISYVHDASFGEHALETFTKDMNARRRSELIPIVRSARRDLALLIVGATYAESYWLLFADHHLLLWRYEGPTGLLNWKPDHFAEPRCGAYEPPSGGCPGVEVSPNGTLIESRTLPDIACLAAFRANHPYRTPTHEPLFPVSLKKLEGFIDGKGEVVIPLCFDAVGQFSEGLAGFERDGLWGYLDRAGNVAIAPRFPRAGEFHEGLVRVQVSGRAFGWGGQWGFIDRTGAVVIQTPIDPNDGDAESAEFHDGLAAVGPFGKMGFIEKSGKLAFGRRFGYVDRFRDGLAVVSDDSNGDRWGYINTAGHWVIPASFDHAGPFAEGLAAVSRKRDCGFIDRTGAFVLKPPVPPGETDCATVWGSFHDGLSRWRFGKQFGFIDHAGKIVVEPRFDLTYGFSEGLAAVQINGRWGYIDTHGVMVIEPRELDSAAAFRDGLASVRTKDGRHGYIDRSGKYVWGPLKDDDEE